MTAISSAQDCCCACPPPPCDASNPSNASTTMQGGKAVFVEGDIAEEDTSTRMIETGVKTFGKVDLALNNAGVMDAVFSGDPVDYMAQKDRVFARLHESTDLY